MKILHLSIFSLVILSFYIKQLTADKEIGIRKLVTSKIDQAPLFLTPLLENGRIAEAQERSHVHFEEAKIVESYSGYFTVNKKFNSNLFFWYFPSKANRSTDPLLLWLQGGPGASSLFGLFTGNGPFVVTEQNKLELRNITWVSNHNVLYIDSPVGTGFSFTDNEADYATSLSGVMPNLYNALQQFFELFPELRKNEFYVTGESYGGKYVPALAHEIYKANKNINVRNKINLVGISIGNGWTDPINQLEYSKYAYQLGLLDENGQKQLRTQETKVKSLMRKGKYTKAFQEFKLIMDENKFTGLFNNLTGFNWYYNYLHNEEPRAFSSYPKWVQQFSVKRAVHAGHREFISSSEKVYDLMSDDFLRSAANDVATLLEHYRVLIYYGQLDIVCAYPKAVDYLKQLHWSGAEEYKKSVRKLWFVENELAGYTKSVRNLTEVLARNAGHMVPTDQPFWTWRMISGDVTVFNGYSYLWSLCAQNLVLTIVSTFYIHQYWFLHLTWG